MNFVRQSPSCPPPRSPPHTHLQSSLNKELQIQSLHLSLHIVFKDSVFSCTHSIVIEDQYYPRSFMICMLNFQNSFCLSGRKFLIHHFSPCVAEMCLSLFSSNTENFFPKMLLKFQFLFLYISPTLFILAAKDFYC